LSCSMPLFCGTEALMKRWVMTAWSVILRLSRETEDAGAVALSAGRDVFCTASCCGLTATIDLDAAAAVVFHSDRATRSPFVPSMSEDPRNPRKPGKQGFPSRSRLLLLTF